MNLKVNLRLTYKKMKSLRKKGVKASATRARKALQELGKLIKSRRKEILEEKAAASSK